MVFVPICKRNLNDTSFVKKLPQSEVYINVNKCQFYLNSYYDCITYVWKDLARMFKTIVLKNCPFFGKCHCSKFDRLQNCNFTDTLGIVTRHFQYLVWKLLLLYAFSHLMKGVAALAGSDMPILIRHSIYLFSELYIFSFDYAYFLQKDSSDEKILSWKYILCHITQSS